MPDPNLDRLKAVSPRMTIQVWGSDECMLRKAAWFRDSDIEKVAADILRLAEDVEKAYHEGYDQGVTGQPRRKRLTPATRKDDDEKH